MGQFDCIFLQTGSAWSFWQQVIVEPENSSFTFQRLRVITSWASFHCIAGSKLVSITFLVVQKVLCTDADAAVELFADLAPFIVQCTNSSIRIHYSTNFGFECYACIFPQYIVFFVQKAMLVLLFPISILKKAVWNVLLGNLIIPVKYKSMRTHTWQTLELVQNVQMTDTSIESFNDVTRLY